MQIIYKKSFKKSLAKQALSVKIRFIEKSLLLLQDSNHPALRIHLLKGKLSGLQSFDITSDVRVHFYVEDDIYLCKYWYT